MSVFGNYARYYDLLYRDKNFGSWDVLVNFPYRQRLDSSGLSHSPIPVFMNDRNGKVWVAVQLDKGMCFVRANNRHIMPLYDYPE